MMILSEQLQRMIRDFVRTSPLEGAEVRRLEGLGGLYISRGEADTAQFTYQLSLEIDGTPYRIYREHLQESLH